MDAYVSFIQDSVPVPRRGESFYLPAIDEATIVSRALWNLQEFIIDYSIGAFRLKTMINPVRTLANPSESITLGTLMIRTSSFVHFNLNMDQAMVATRDPGAADYFVFPVTNPWMVTAINPARGRSVLMVSKILPTPMARTCLWSP